MNYILLYLPTGKEFIDGHEIIDQSGNLYIYDESEHTSITLATYQPAEPWLVKRQFNKDIPIGRPSPKSLKWLKQGDVVKMVDCEAWLFNTNTKMFERPFTPEDAIPHPGDGYCIYYRVKCPTCGDLH